MAAYAYIHAGRLIERANQWLIPMKHRTARMQIDARSYQDTRECGREDRKFTMDRNWQRNL
jgi:hypothetical protein